MVNIWILNWTYLDFLLIVFFQKRSSANSGAVNCWNYLSTQFIAISLSLCSLSWWLWWDGIWCRLLLDPVEDLMFKWNAPGDRVRADSLSKHPESKNHYPPPSGDKNSFNWASNSLPLTLFMRFFTSFLLYLTLHLSPSFHSLYQSASSTETSNPAYISDRPLKKVLRRQVSCAEKLEEFTIMVKN